MEWPDAAIERLYEEVGRRIRSARSLSGLSQLELAGAVGLTRSSIANVEAGRQKMLLHSLVRIAEVLDVTVSTLVPDPDQLKQAVNEHEFAPDLTGHTDDTRNFVTSAIMRAREATRGSSETS